MIKLIHRHNKIITYVFLFIALCFMFSGVGLDILHSGQGSSTYAIKINDKDISFQEVERVRENVTARYRQMFGANFEAFAKSFNLNVSQQAVDSLIDTTLLDQEAAQVGFAGNEEVVSKFITTKLLAGREISRESLRATLQNLGMNYRQLSEQVKSEASREALMNLVRDVSFVNKQDVEAQYSSQETTYALVTATVEHATLVSKVPPPTEEALEKLYNTTATSYEVPAQVSYEFLAFYPKDFKQEVQVLPQDLEFFYTEHTSKFKTPEQARIKSITMLYPKENDPAAMAAVREKATRAREEALSGQPFQELVLKYSDDLPSKATGGEKGWVERGKGDKAFDKAVFSAATGSVAELVESSSGFQVILVEEKKDAGLKPFSDVKTSIEEEIRSREAPSYAAAKAQELVALAKKNGISITQAASMLKLPAPKVATLSQQGQDPDPLLQGLTKRALQIPAGDRLIATTLDIGEATIALQIKEFKEPSIQPFEAVKDRVLQSHNQEQAAILASKLAQELREGTLSHPETLATNATDKGYKVTGPFDISRAKPSNPAMTALPPELASDVFASVQAPRVLSQTYRLKDGYVVATVTKVTRPDLSAPSAVQAMKEYKETADEASQQQALKSVISILKARSEIDVDPSLLGARS